MSNIDKYAKFITAQKIAENFSSFLGHVAGALPHATQHHEELKKKVVHTFASQTHEAWRNTLTTKERAEPRPRSKKGGPKQDINVSFDKLHPTAQQENIDAGHAAWVAHHKFPHDEEARSAHIHNEWMKRNPKDEYNAHQHVPYEHLDEPNKDLDRAQSRLMGSLIQKHR